jgi:dipeptidyl aminopeptidase/acylaminoacyl peptidase
MLSVMKAAATMFTVLVAISAARSPGVPFRPALRGATQPARPDLKNDSALTPRVFADRQRLVIRSLDGEFIRELPLLGESNHVPVWSPDGKSIAFQVRGSGRNVLAVMRSNGTAPHVFGDAAAAMGQNALWSPDSRFIGFLDPQRHEFRLLNVATGSIRTVATDTAARVGVWKWRADARSIAAVMTMPGSTPGLRSLRRRVDEITLDGARRTLLDTAAMRSVPGVTFVDADTIFVRYDSAAYRRPLDGGGPQRLTDLSAPTQPWAGVHTTAPTSQVWAGVTPGALLHGGRVEFISARTGEHREVVVPFHPAPGPSPEWTPDGRELVVVGWPLEDTTGITAATIRLARNGDTTAVRDILARQNASTVLYRVTVDGGKSRLIARFRGMDGWVSVSPDGRSVVYGAIDARSPEHR